MSDAALRVAIVGPSHPDKGGVAAHTTTMAHELAEAGHEVTLVSWSHLYPSFLYPGERAVPGGVADVEPFPRTVRVLSWARPDTWVRAGRRLREMDAIIVVHVVPPVVPAHVALLRAAGATRTRVPGPRSIVIAHNVLPHEARLGDARLMRALLGRVDSVVVHSDAQAALAAALGARHVRELDLPPHLPGGPALPHVASDGPTRILALGLVREYKGVDILLEAAREVPGVRITVAGEMWGEAGRRVKELAREPRLRDRVEVHGGYVPADRIPGLLARHDVLALTYRDATASQNVLLARRHGLPVLASDIGTFPDQVRHGRDGLLVPPGDVAAVASALRRLADRSYAAALRTSVRPLDESGPWATYVGALEALASTESDATGERPLPGPVDGPRARLRTRIAMLRNQVAPRTVLDLRSTDFPAWIRPSDVLTLDRDALEARASAHDLGLPRCADAVAAWAALGALAAIVRITDGDGKRTTVIVDESGSGSPLSRWARALGFAPVELELTGSRSCLEVLDVDTASLDVITRVHPGGSGAEDIDHTIGQASWALRSGGLLVVTLPLGEGDPQWSLTPADIRGVLARAEDLGLALVGDLDGDLLSRMRRTSADPRGAAYGILRLTFRRR